MNKTLLTTTLAACLMAGGALAQPAEERQADRGDRVERERPAHEDRVPEALRERIREMRENGERPGRDQLPEELRERLHALRDRVAESDGDVDPERIRRRVREIFEEHAPENFEPRERRQGPPPWAERGPRGGDESGDLERGNRRPGPRGSRPGDGDAKANRDSLPDRGERAERMRERFREDREGRRGDGPPPRAERGPQGRRGDGDDPEANRGSRRQGPPPWAERGPRNGDDAARRDRGPRGPQSDRFEMADPRRDQFRKEMEGRRGDGPPPWSGRDDRGPRGEKSRNAGRGPGVEQGERMRERMREHLREDFRARLEERHGDGPPPWAGRGPRGGDERPDAPGFRGRFHHQDDEERPDGPPFRRGPRGER